MDACPIPQAAEPCALVIFGASGDLTKRKLVPSLYNLASYHLLPADFSIIGVARRPLSDDVFRDQLGKTLQSSGRNRSIRISGAGSGVGFHIVRANSTTRRLIKKLTEALAGIREEF